MTVFVSPDVIVYFRCLSELDEMILEGNDEGEEGELLRCQMEFHWLRLSEQEQEIVRSNTPPTPIFKGELR